VADLYAEYRIILNSEFKIRKEKNPRFSLRAFALLLGVDASYLSKINSGKLILSVDIADKMTHKLKLNIEDRKKFILSAAEEQRCHAVYLVDPNLTDCEPSKDSLNKNPFLKSKNKL
jgi:transcriptional regulator with XRE-family HTH domain